MRSIGNGTETNRKALTCSRLLVFADQPRLRSLNWQLSLVVIAAGSLPQDIGSVIYVLPNGNGNAISITITARKIIKPNLLRKVP
ncbi:hypothetical protein ACFL5F_07495 [Planctomycetota bacterium]